MRKSKLFSGTRTPHESQDDLKKSGEIPNSDGVIVVEVGDLGPSRADSTLSPHDGPLIQGVDSSSAESPFSDRKN